MLGYNICILINSLLHGQQKRGKKILCATPHPTSNNEKLIFCIHTVSEEFNLEISKSASYKDALNVVRNFID